MPISSINPATGEVLKTFEALNKRELEEKLSRAAAVFREHRRATFHDRAAMMNRAAEILESEKKRFARTPGTSGGSARRCRDVNRQRAGGTQRRRHCRTTDQEDCAGTWRQRSFHRHAFSRP